MLFFIERISLEKNEKISLTILFLSVSILLNLCNFASAEDFTYKVLEQGNVDLSQYKFSWREYSAGTTNTSNKFL